MGQRPDRQKIADSVPALNTTFPVVHLLKDWVGVHETNGNKKQMREVAAEEQFLLQQLKAVLENKNASLKVMRKLQFCWTVGKEKQHLTDQENPVHILDSVFFKLHDYVNECADHNLEFTEAELAEFEGEDADYDTD